MPDSQINDVLNDLLVQIHRSLVQYVHEAWPWKHNGDEAVLAVINELAKAQQEDSRSLFQFLLDRDERPDLGVYPTDYTSLHFVSLDYLYPLIVEGQKELVEQIEAAVPVCGCDPSVCGLIERIAASQREGLAKLQNVTPPSPATAV